MEEALDALMADTAAAPSDKPTQLRGNLAIRVRTARTWLRKLGLKYGRFGKGVFKDGHEREDVKEYRQNIFAPTFCAYLKNSVQFDEDGSVNIPEGFERPLVFITHDESYFNANDTTMFGWGNDSIKPIRPKGRGKGIMVSDFLTPGGRLSHDAGGGTKEYATTLVEPGSGKDWWTNGMMLEQLKKAVTIFKKQFPNCTGVWLFDNSTNHGAYAADALVASHVAMNPGGKQPKMKDGYIGTSQCPQTMCYPPDHDKFPGCAKGARAILQERGLWRDGLLLTCSNKMAGHKEDSPEEDCCARAILKRQPDFKAQKSQIEEYLTSQGQLVLFYPKFHCECNWIERYWGYCKRYTRENCSYNITGLRQNVPVAMEQVPGKTIKRFFDKSVRIIQAYADGIDYETKEYQERVYRSHRRLDEKDKW